MNLTIKNISKKYKDKLALNNFCVELTDGVYGLLGPNGAGKSTLMKIIANVLNPTSGNITVDGEDITVMDEQYRNLLGYLPQEFGTYKNFSAERFLMYIASLKGIPKDEAKKKVAELLDLVNLKDVAKKKTGKFSGGMKQRLGIAQALLNNPKILILDEPTAGLDPKERIRFRNIISDISKNRIVILSTHIVSDIEYIAKEVILVKNGQMIKKSDGQTLLNDVRGNVWKVKVSEKEVEKLQNEFSIGNIFRKDNYVELIIVSPKQPHIDALQIEPSFEDIYMYYFDEASV